MAAARVIVRTALFSVAAALMTLSIVGPPLHAASADSAPPLPAPAGPVVNVASVAALQSAVSSLSSNTTIVIAPGTYHLTSTLWVNGAMSNVTIRGATNNRHDVVLVGKGMGVPSGAVPFGIWTGNGVTHLTIANLTIRDIYQHPIMFNAGTQAPRVYNVRLVNAGEQFLKANPDGAGGGVDDGIVEYSVFEYTNVAPSTYTNGVDVHSGRDWIIRHNVFRRIRSASGLAGPAILMWNGSSGTLVEGNTFVDCHREISLGLVQRTPNDHSGGMVRNNLITRNAGMGGDVAIAVFDSPGTRVLHNSVFLSGQYPNAIEYRFADTTGVEIINNLADRGALARDGATGTQQSNVWTATATWFTSPETGDLHLTAQGAAAVDAGTTVAGAPTDWDGQARPAGAAPDVGADEAGGASAPWMQNASFASGTSGWLTFGDISGAVNGGVFEYYWVPDASPSAAVIFQPTGQPVGTGTALAAEFRLGNSSSVRKRISVLMHDQSFSDLAVCVFWLPPGAPLATYRMTSRATTPWANATISFYAATPGEDGGRYRLDAVSFGPTADPVPDRTSCVDPAAPVPPGGSDGPNLVTNGTFTGTAAPWQTFGTLTWQLAGDTLEFVRPTAVAPAGVIFQPTSTALAAGDAVTATVALGNSSGVRKRVTVLLHDLDFTDLAACTWWLDPGAPLLDHTLRTVVGKPGGWANATISVYAATVGPETWIRLDDVVLRRTPSAPVVGTECLDPSAGAGDLTSAGGVPEPVPGQSPPASPAMGPATGADWVWSAPATGEQYLELPGVLDLRPARQATLAFDSWLTADRAVAELQVSLDGMSWLTVAALPASDSWARLAVDLSGFAGRVVRVRLVLSSPPTGRDRGGWHIRRLALSIG